MVVLFLRKSPVAQAKKGFCVVEDDLEFPVPLGYRLQARSTVSGSVMITVLYSALCFYSWFRADVYWVKL